MKLTFYKLKISFLSLQPRIKFQNPLPRMIISR